MVVHPLVLDSARGFIQWSADEWNNLHNDLLTILEQYEDLQIHFSEGVGKKGEENCMIGADMIAIDGSGDFSGCYFFTNHKAGAVGETILGNLFQDKIYIDRYTAFQTEYAKMFEEEEQCKSCNYKNACYQCPAGNLDTGSKKMFRPDDMCQKIVKLFIDLQEDISKKQFKKKYESIVSALETEGEQSALIKGISYLLFYYFYNYHPSPITVHTGLNAIDDYRKLLSLWKKIINLDVELKLGPDRFVEEITSLVDDSSIEISDLYYYIVENGKIITNPKRLDSSTMNEYQRAFYLGLLHMIILQSETKALTDTFTHRLIKHDKSKSSR
jgi:radical SAM protein with 4Fe4S-binding SPASM domain